MKDHGGDGEGSGTLRLTMNRTFSINAMPTSGCTIRPFLSLAFFSPSPLPQGKGEGVEG